MGTREIAQWKPLPWFLVSPPNNGGPARSRDRLLRLIDESVDLYPLTLLSAPSGYAKTALLSTWAVAEGRRVAWLSLSRHIGENEESLLGGIISSLHRLAPRLGANDAHLLSRIFPDEQGAQATLELVASRLLELDEPIVMVVDDAHLGGSTLSSALLQTLTDHCQNRLRFVLAGTAELNQSFNRMLARGIATRLGPAELSLTVAEIVEDFHRAGIALPEEAAQSLHNENGGWPIAVQLEIVAGSSGSGGTGPVGHSVLTEFVATSILGQMRPELAEFVLAGTTCLRLDATLAHLLTGAGNSSALLEECANQGIFLDRYESGEHRTVYKWRQEFSTQCQQILDRTDSGRRRRLNAIAAQALARLFPMEAMSHALLAGDAEALMGILREQWLRIVIESGAAELNDILLQLPGDVALNPEILLIRSACLDLLGDAPGSTLLRLQARGALSAMDVVPHQVRATLAFATLFTENDAGALAIAVDSAREHSAELQGNPVTNAFAMFFLGWTELRLRRNPAAAVRMLRSALDQAENSGLQTLSQRARANLMLALSFGGYFSSARALMAKYEVPGQDATVLEWNHYDGAIEHFARGFADYWQGRLPEANQTFLDMVAQGGHQASYTALARVFLALCAADTGDARDIRAAESRLDGVSQSHQHGVPWPIYGLIAAASLRAASGEPDAAFEMVRDIRDVAHVPVCLALAAELARLAGRPADALQMLGGISSTAMTSYVSVSALITSAVISRGRGEGDAAHRQLEKALDLAMKESIVRPFAGGDDALVQLLTEHAAWGTAHEGFLAARLAQGPDNISRQAMLGTQLSKREQEVFGFLRTTMTAEEIAAALFVSVNTVRTHQRSIYRKLGVSTRRDAIRLRP